ncbi:flagellar protein G [Thermococcus radiotolerans]|uniref:Flagellar protein G n=1 Tax=Thermococcus radiotolerans TaxID=187880 RepID=A0A2Z2N029_9EURY|nr:flagellar protein G [Thermococcus radiotolerans]ASJ13790.1 flagellar protein G [Thermococcus radiotolerans]
MASSVVSELVLFIVSLLVAGMVAGGLYVVTQDISGGILTKGQDVAESLRTNFEIINDPENIPVSGSSYVFYIRNIGKDSFSFDPNSVVVMIDGSMIPPANLTFEPSGALAPYEVGKIYVPTAFISSGYHKITVVIETGKRKSLVFEVG